MIHPCPIKPPCLPGSQFLGEDTPFANISAESPDIDLFLGSNFGWDLNVVRLGWVFTDTDGPAWCRGATQQLADQCAANLQLTQQIGTWQNQNGFPPPLFFNQQVQCPFTCPDGLQFVWTVAAGTFQSMDQATANSIALSFACQQALRFYICLGSLNANACVGTQYSSTVAFTGGKAPIGSSVTSGVLPPGLLMSQGVDGKSFTISGTPTSAGNFTFTVTATDALGNFMRKQYTLSVLGISNLSSLPNAVENTAYSFQLTGAGGVSPFTFTLLSGSLPGITLSPSGLLSGTPNYVTAGSYPFTVQITDSIGNTCIQQATLIVKLRPGPDWTLLNWTQYVITQGIAGSSASGGAIKNTAFGSIHYTGLQPFPGITPAAASGVTYTGPQVTARVLLTVSVSGTAGNDMAFSVFRNGAQIGGYAGAMTSGTFHFDIVIPIGVNDVYTITDLSPGNTFAQLFGVGLSGDLSFTVAIVNV